MKTQFAVLTVSILSAVTVVGCAPSRTILTRIDMINYALPQVAIITTQDLAKGEIITENKVTRIDFKPGNAEEESKHIFDQSRVIGQPTLAAVPKDSRLTRDLVDPKSIDDGYGPVVCALADVNAGSKFTRDNVVAIEIPQSRISHGAITAAYMAIGRCANNKLEKGQVISVYDLDARENVSNTP